MFEEGLRRFRHAPQQKHNALGGDELISNETSRRDTADLQGMALCVKP
jgi:hypothetical protein